MFVTYNQPETDISPEIISTATYSLYKSHIFWILYIITPPYTACKKLPNTQTPKQHPCHCQAVLITVYIRTIKLERQNKIKKVTIPKILTHHLTLNPRFPSVHSPANRRRFL